MYLADWKTGHIQDLKHIFLNQTKIWDKQHLSEVLEEILYTSCISGLQPGIWHKPRLCHFKTKVSCVPPELLLVQSGKCGHSVDNFIYFFLSTKNLSNSTIRGIYAPDITWNFSPDMNFPDVHGAPHTFMLLALFTTTAALPSLPCHTRQHSRAI